MYRVCNGDTRQNLPHNFNKLSKAIDAGRRMNDPFVIYKGRHRVNNKKNEMIGFYVPAAGWEEDKHFIAGKGWNWVH